MFTYIQNTSMLQSSSNQYSLLTQAHDLRAKFQSDLTMHSLIARFMGSTWGPAGADRTPCWPHELCYRGSACFSLMWIWIYVLSVQLTNTLRPRQNGGHFPDDILKWIFLNENVLISIKISLNFVPEGLIYNIPALGQIMAWCWPGGKP